MNVIKYISLELIKWTSLVVADIVLKPNPV